MCIVLFMCIYRYSLLFKNDVTLFTCPPQESRMVALKAMQTMFFITVLFAGTLGIVSIALYGISGKFRCCSFSNQFNKWEDCLSCHTK